MTAAEPANGQSLATGGATGVTGNAPAGTAGTTVRRRTVRPEFSGSTGEYFRIWIVNLFFSLVTLGVFSPWAKVRKKKYFYGSTRFDGDTFDYFGNPKAILKGRVIAVVIFILYAIASELYPAARLIFWGAALLLFPLVIVRALAFNARNSAYRGLRFDFLAKPKEAAWIYIGKLAVVVLTLGFALPWFMARQKAFVVSQHAFGTTRFHCELPAGKFFGIYFRGGLIVIGCSIPGVMAAIAVGQFAPRAELPWVSTLAWVLPLIFVYAGYIVSYAYIQARTTNLLWGNTSGSGVRFQSSLKASRLIGLHFGNIVAAALSLGLLIPWAVIRTLRYRLDNFSGTIDDDVAHEASPRMVPVGAAGQELGDIFNLDLGL